MKIKLSYLSLREMGQRTNQEDSIWPDENSAVSTAGLFILCDGMGGHESGEVASQTVCSSMSEYVLTNCSPDELFTEDDFKKALDAAYDALDSKDNGAEKKMGTTLTFVKLHKGGCFVAHIGDSRVYYIRPSEKKIIYVTRDHSLVNDLVELGEMTPEEAKVSKQKNVITRAMQPLQPRRMRADCRDFQDVRPGDYIYMCSDGMLEVTADDEILNIISMDVPDEEKISILRQVTQNNRDNHTAHLIHILDVERAADEVPAPVTRDESPKGDVRSAAPESASEPASEPVSKSSAPAWNEQSLWVTLGSFFNNNFYKKLVLAILVVAIVAICVLLMNKKRKHAEVVDHDDQTTETINKIQSEQPGVEQPNNEVGGQGEGQPAENKDVKLE